jgi:hypothetical protein
MHMLGTFFSLSQENDFRCINFSWLVKPNYAFAWHLFAQYFEILPNYASSLCYLTLFRTVSDLVIQLCKLIMYTANRILTPERTNVSRSIGISFEKVCTVFVRFALKLFVAFFTRLLICWVCFDLERT